MKSFSIEVHFRYGPQVSARDRKDESIYTYMVETFETISVVPNDPAITQPNSPHPITITMDLTSHGGTGSQLRFLPCYLHHLSNPILGSFKNCI